MGLPLLLLVALLVVLAVVRWLVPEKGADFNTRVGSVQSIIAILAVAGAGYWYLIERKGTAHANIEISATGVRLNETTVLVRARVQIENASQILLSPGRWDVRLQSVVPPRDFQLEAAARQAQTREQFDQWPAQIDGRAAYSENEIQWTTVRHFAGAANHQIEPGERDERIFDLLVSCDVETANLVVWLSKPNTGEWAPSQRPGGWWWRRSMMLGLGSLCRGEIGVVRTLGPETGNPSPNAQRGD